MNHSSDHYKTWLLYCPSNGYYLVGFWRSSVGNCCFNTFSWNSCMCFFKVKHHFGNLRNSWSDWSEKKRKGIGWILGMIYDFDFDITHDLDLGCFKVNFRNSCILRIAGPIDGKWKGRELIGYWANFMTLPFDHTHDLDIGVSRSGFEKALSHQWDGWLTWNEKVGSHPLMTITLTSVTMVGRADVLDSDWGDLRRRCAINISSLVIAGHKLFSRH